jgi:acetyl esterase/lipase
MTDPEEVLTRAARSPDLTLRYGPSDDHLIDVRLPVQHSATIDRPRQLVVVIHGGFWRGGYDRQHASAQSAALADAGYIVATPEYRRVGPGGGGWPETFDDLADVSDRVSGLVSAAVGQSARDSSTILVGHSAGAHLALWAAARHQLPPTSRWYRASPGPVRGVVSLAGVSDLLRADDLGLGSGAVSDLLKGRSGEQPERYAAANPAGLLPLGVPTALIHGDKDDLVPVELSHAYAQRARVSGDPVHFDELPDVGHYELIDPLSSAWSSVLGALEWVTAEMVR